MKLAFGSLYVCALLVAPALADDAREAVQQGGFLPLTHFGAAAIHEVRTHVFAGVDSKLGVDLEREEGPLATLTSGKVQLTASAGFAAQRERTASASDVGVYGGAGVGGVF